MPLPDKTTGEPLHHYTTADEPGGRLRVACGNRRASRCPACAWTYAGDTYHLIRVGLTGDDRRDIPATVRDHPRVSATLTAPSFGPVQEGRPVPPLDLRPQVAQARKQVGMPDNLRFYDFRHTGNTLAADTGAKLRTSWSAPGSPRRAPS